MKLCGQGTYMVHSQSTLWSISANPEQDTLQCTHIALNIQVWLDDTRMLNQQLWLHFTE